MKGVGTFDSFVQRGSVGHIYVKSSDTLNVEGRDLKCLTPQLVSPAEVQVGGCA